MKLIKFNFSQITILTKNQIGLFFKNYKFITLIIIFILLNILLNVLGLLFINPSFDFLPSEKLTRINILIAVTSILLIIQTVFITVNCFIIQIKNNIHTTELRYGYRTKNIYWSRLMFVLIFSLFYLLIMLLISSIFFFIGKAQDIYQSIYLYRLFISAFAWYAILIFLSIVITIILARFLSEASTSIIASVIGILFILIPAISGFASNFLGNASDSNESYLFLITEDYRRKLYNDLKDDENFKNIFPEFEFVYNKGGGWTLQKEKLLAGSQFWNLSEAEQTKIQNYSNLTNIVAEILQNGNQITSWNSSIPEITGFGFYKLNESINKILNKLKTNKAMSKYNYLLKIIEKYTINFNVLKWLGIIYQPTLEGSNEIRSKFDSSDEYIFIKTLNSLLNRLVQPWLDDPVFVNNDNNRPIVIKAKDRIKKDKISNILNPLRHFNLMFQSINYNNKFLSNIFGQEQLLYSNVPNIDFAFSGNSWELDSSFKLKQNVPVEAIYIFYFVLGSLLIWLSSLGFKKKIKQ